MILQVYLNECHIGDYNNPTFVGLKLYTSSKNSEYFVCINDNKIAIFNYKNTDCEIDAFCCHVNDLANKEMQKHYDWTKLELWNDMYTKKLKWQLSYSAYKENKSFIRSILDSL